MYKQSFIGDINIKTNINQFIDILNHFSDVEIKRDDLNVSVITEYDERKSHPFKLKSISIRKQGEEFIIRPSCPPGYHVKIYLLNSGEGDYSEIVLSPTESNTDLYSLSDTNSRYTTNLMTDIKYEGESKISIDQAVYGLRNIIGTLEMYCQIERIHIMID